MNVISETLDSIRIGLPVTAGGLTMYPLLGAVSPSAAYLLLDDALECGAAEITEISQSGSVPELHFRNKGDQDILLVDGEELVGAKQNRVLNLTILVGAGQDVKIPVSCVEAGRWSWRSNRFAPGKRNLHARARAAKMHGVSESLARDGLRAGPEVQADVWRSVDEKMAAFRVRSATNSLHDVYAAKETLLGAVRDAFLARTGQTGAAFAIGERMVGCDLYDSPATLRKLLPKLVDSFAFDAIESVDATSEEPPSADSVLRMLRAISGAQCREYPAIAKGRDIRIASDPIIAAALVADGRVAHLAAFC